MPLEEGDIFLLKRLLPMMFLLVCNIIIDRLNIGFADCKSSVARLPRESGEFSALGLDPFGGGFFHVFYGLTYAYCSSEFKEDMDMIFDRIDECWRTFQFLEHNRHVGVEGVSDLIVQDRCAILGAENEMNVKTGERLRHD